jgi:predicted ribosomally synthesized peptide with SipW-like signal peptide
MTDEDNADGGNDFSLSRRKALGGLASIGAATTLGGAATFAKLSDTEDRAVTFTAGGLDGTLEWSGSYNGEPVDGSRSTVTVNPDLEASGYNDRAVPIDVEFTDVKPGDYGCVNFTLEVETNEAWVASGINVVDNHDYKNFEPEIAEDGNLDSDDVNVDEDGNLIEGEADTDGNGDLAQNIYVIPYYDSDANCQFFDDGGLTEEYAGATPTGFWSNAQPEVDGGFTPQGDFDASTLPGDLEGIDEDTEYYLAPRSLTDVSQNLNAIGTALWNDDDMTIGYQTASGGHASLATGSVMLDGSVPQNGDSGNNSQTVKPLKPGDTLNFGYDFHIPFGVGNEIQGDRTSIKLDFQFIQSRHTEAPDFTTYNPE